MKKLLPIIFIALVFAGCKKNNSNDTPADPNADNPTKILGKWKDDVATSTFYTGGQVVFVQNYSAPTSVTEYYEFTSGGVFNDYQLNGTTATLYSTENYTLISSNTVLHLYVGSNTLDVPLSFINSSTLTLTFTTLNSTNTPVTYTSNGVTHTADKEVDVENLVKY